MWKVGLRKSPLSLRQWDEVKALGPWLPLEPVLMDTPGDRDQTLSLLNGEAPEDFFTRDLDQALLKGEIDLALHSAKDLPWPLPKGLEVLALTPRQDPADTLFSLDGWSWETLPQGARVGTSSPARKTGLLSLRPDLEIVSIRGTIGQRLALLEEPQGPQAIVVAQCALDRLEISGGVKLPFETHPLQGHLALVGRAHQIRLKKALEPLDVRRTWGRVSLVGAGPGRKDLLTLGAWERLQQAEVIFYDALLEEDWLENLPWEKVFVGKRQGCHASTQDQTNQLLADAALAGKQVVRLKGGDPLILGRGSEEAEFLGRRLISYEILPGISAAQTAAAFCEIPLTERGRSASFSVASGTPAEQLLWTGAQTQAFYMATKALGRLADLAQEAGAPDQPLAAVQAAGSPFQTLRQTVLSQAKAWASESLDGPPVLYLTGPTLDHRAGNGWFDRLPRVLYTGTEIPQKGGPMTERAVHRPFIQVQALAPDNLTAGGIDIQDLAKSWDWILFTSPMTVRFFFESLKAHKADTRVLAGLKVGAIGQTTARALQDRGLIPDWAGTPGEDHSEALVQALGHLWSGPRQRVLLPRSDRALDIIPQGLRNLGHQVTPWILYRTLLTPAAREDLTLYHEIVFSSPSAVESFRQVYDHIPGEISVRLRGPQTAKAFKDAFPQHPEAQS